MWRITQTTDGQHLGEVLVSVEKGQIVTFPDGDVVPIERTFFSEEGTEVIASGPNYQMTLIKE
jgi:hypothetical protein